MLPGDLIEPCKKTSREIAKVIHIISDFIELQEIEPLDVCGIAKKCEVHCCVSSKPEQLRLSLTGNHEEMTVSWIANNDLSAYIRYGKSGVMNNTKLAKVSTFNNGGWVGYTYTVTLNGLEPHTKYTYIVGSDEFGWSEPSEFKTFTNKNFADLKVRLAITGDLGATIEGEDTIKRLADLASSHYVNSILHSGDIGYADGIQRIWDKFGRMIQPISRFVPYMVAAGNHEIAVVSLLDLETFTERWFMPFAMNSSKYDEKPYFYSIDYGPVHAITLNTEHPLNYPYLSDIQLQWLENDLIKANQVRHIRPWIIVHFHRPMYCTSTRTLQCYDFGEILKSYLEDIFAKYQVDIVFSGHLHYYERTWPVYKNITDKNLINPKYPIYIVNGAGGNREGFSGMKDTVPDWSAYRLKDWGYGILEANSTRLTWEFFKSSNNQLMDRFILEKK